MSIAELRNLAPTDADIQIQACLAQGKNFSVVAGAGSGKTTSLVLALDYIRQQDGKHLRRDDKKIACITFTNRAVDVISERLGWDDIYFVATLHKFLWGEIKKFTGDIRASLKDVLIPQQIDKNREKDNGGSSQKAIAAREKVASLEADIVALDEVDRFSYDDTSSFSNYQEGKLSHDDIIAVSGVMIARNETFRKVLGQRYPYLFVDEAQDTFPDIIQALNLVCEADGLPLIGYFGDPMQQIYERGMGDFQGPEGSLLIPKQENFRCAPAVINLLNSFRNDLQQIPAGRNAEVTGSVELLLVQSEPPEGDRKKYSDAQLDKAATIFENIVNSWGWQHRTDVKHLFLVRQMIARRLGFSGLHSLFTGPYASSRAQEDYESGEHALLKPFVRTIWPLVNEYSQGNIRSVMNILRESSPAFHPEGENAQKSLKQMLELAESLAIELSDRWKSNDLGNILRFARDNNLCSISERLMEELDREPMEDEYDKNIHSLEKGRWLADDFFRMDSTQIARYVDFVNDNTPFSTQHGVKGEEYPNVVVVFDDTEAAWSLYSFAKMLTPGTSGEGTDGQLNRSRKLAYVCFSRAEVNLKIILFSPNPISASEELISAGLFSKEQILFWEQ